ncbi:MAG: crossover junction endodeoxyribonuclease RuvC [Caldimicrobium sp.]
MKILGVDPGLLNLGCVLIEVDKGKCQILESITLKTKNKDPLEKRLYYLYSHLKKLLENIEPEYIAIEEPLAKANPYTTARIFQAQGMVLLLAEEKNIPLKIYYPSYWKSFLCNHGKASKNEVYSFLKTLFGGYNLDKVRDNHMVDALALALVCAMELKVL